MFKYIFSFGLLLTCEILFAGTKGGGPSKPETPGKGLKAKEILAVIRSNMKSIQICYEEELKTSPGLMGTLEINWIIDLSGVVKDVEYGAKSDIKNEALRSCVNKNIYSWKFPKPRGGETVKVTYPFVFNPF